ncbi:ABC transporter ATP-binding protein [Georgenia sp. Z1491]|uniref:ABC transporter ATP-binding protein n=1 Tax=Georgenia sp. Z1491 TaxID=3416707 RepID=UPI003CED958E
MLLRLLRYYLRPHARTLGAILLLQLVSTLAAMMLPSLTADVINDGLLAADSGAVIRIGLVMLGISAIQMAAQITTAFLAARMAARAGGAIRRSVFAKVQRLSVAEVSTVGAPSLVTRSTNDVLQVQMLTLMGSMFLVMSPMMMVGGIVMAVREDPPLSWLIVAAVPALLLVMLGAILLARPMFEVVQKRIDRINRLMREQVSGVRVIRAFTRQGTQRATFDVASNELAGTQRRIGVIFGITFPLVQLLIMGGQVLVVWFGGLRVDANQMEIGSIVAFLSYLMFIFMSVMFSVMLLMMVPRAAVCARRIVEVLDIAPAIAPPAQPEPIGDRAEGRRVDLVDVTFGYPGADEPVLDRISLTLEPGTTTAVVGSTGSGKTTLVNLLPRLLDVSSGSVRIGGVDVRAAALPDVRSRIALVPQQAYLFGGTVRSTLSLGSGEVPEERLWQALEVAQAAEFVSDLDDGLDSAVEPGGQNFSGGQRQRLAIARALVHGGEIYVFDDAFSALDMATDARLRAALPQMTTGATVLVVAQRVSTVRDADQIVVLDAGRVVGRGTHEELMGASETYREIVLSQISAEEAA